MGPDTATVTGPKGQEIYTDEYGRVKVSFPWNRYCSKDENSSCWIRVSHPWAGSSFGGIHLPRIGQEVLVDYLNGDPDRPVITSRLYNAFQMPPWQLPANATQSGILTRSSLGGGYENANALRFEDRKGEEQLWIHAEKNQDIEVENDETHWVGNDRSKTIDRDETSHIKRDRTETVDRDETITVHGNRKEEVDGNETIDIHQNRTETVDGNEKVTIHKNRTKKVDLNETDRIGKNWSINVGMNKTETISLLNVKNVGLVYSENIGMAHTSIVGAQRVEVTGLNKKEVVSGDRSATVSKGDSLTVGESLRIQAKSIEITAETELVISCGASNIKLTPDLIDILSTLVKINT
jgi:type VI secretion system secreted protein VgrG